MSEIKKNIETCRGEDVLAEVSGLPQDPHFGSLVNEALDPLKQQAMHQAGYDGYSEVIAQHKPYTFASFIAQMKSNLLLLLRALWQFPFGAGTLRSLSDDASLRSLADMWQHYITRLSGNETYGIPSRLSDLTNLPSAPLLLADRKIDVYDSVGIEDGMSLAPLVLSNNINATSLIDRSLGGWDLHYNCLHLLSNANLKKVVLQCSTISGFGYYADQVWIPANVEQVGDEPGVFELPQLERFNGSAYTGAPSKNTAMTIWKFPKMTYSRMCFVPCDWVEEIHMPVIQTFGEYASEQFLKGFTALRVLRMKPIDLTYRGSYYINTFCDGDVNLIHLEFTSDVTFSFNMKMWNPTNALDASLDTLVTDEDCHNNLEQFLKNFRDYIALRLTNNGTGKTLTLSQAVYDAIKDESHLFVFPEGTMTIYAYLTNIKHWTVTK